MRISRILQVLQIFANFRVTPQKTSILQRLYVNRRVVALWFRRKQSDTLFIIRVSFEDPKNAGRFSEVLPYTTSTKLMSLRTSSHSSREAHAHKRPKNLRRRRPTHTPARNHNAVDLAHREITNSTIPSKFVSGVLRSAPLTPDALPNVVVRARATTARERNMAGLATELAPNPRLPHPSPKNQTHKLRHPGSEMTPGRHRTLRTFTRDPPEHLSHINNAR